MSYRVELFERRTSMLRQILIPIAVASCLWMPSASEAQDSLHDLMHGICIPDCIRKWCCDDYCPKPIPCPVDVTCFGCDCYQPKRLPCPVDVQCLRCDDYCCKPFPSLCCSPNHTLKCAPPLRSPWRANAIGGEINASAGVASSSVSNVQKERTESADAQSPTR